MLRNTKWTVARGVGQYRLWGKDTRMRFGDTRTSTMASVLLKIHVTENGIPKPNLMSGLGLTYLTYGSEFSATGGETLHRLKDFTTRAFMSLE